MKVLFRLIYHVFWLGVSLASHIFGVYFLYGHAGKPPPLIVMAPLVLGSSFLAAWYSERVKHALFVGKPVVQFQSSHPLDPMPPK